MTGSASGGDAPQSADPPRDPRDFRAYVRAWLPHHLPREDRGPITGSDRDVARHRILQRQLFDGGLAGLTYPVAYGGKGRTPAFQDILNEETVGYELPTLCNVTLGILGPTILEFGTEAQRQRYLPAILRGEQLWVQLLSEPSGGSDLAGCVTRATRDGEQWILNGSKIWSTGAQFSDYALCLARSNWSLPKHRGLTMCILRLDQPGIGIEPIMQANGDAEFCQEFLTDLRIDGDDILGAENAGWEVASRLLYHERNLAGAASPYTYGLVAEGTPVAPTPHELAEMARSWGTSHDDRVRAVVAEARALDTIQALLVDRIGRGVATGVLQPTAASLLRLFEITKVLHCSDAGLEVAGPGMVSWSASAGATGAPGSSGSWGGKFLMRQSAALAGGSIEMQRNIISERVLGLPRELAPDAGVPFDSVPHNVAAGRAGR